MVQNLLLNYQPNYTYDRKYQSNGVRNKLMSAQRRKTKYDDSEKKYENQKPRRNLEYITYNDCGEKGQYVSNNE